MEFAGLQASLESFWLPLTDQKDVGMGEPREAKSVKEAGSGWEAGSNMWEKRVGCLGLGKEATAEVGVKAVFPMGGSDSAVGIYIFKKP